MRTILRIILGALAVLVTAYVLPGVTVSGFFTAVVVAIVLAVVSAFLGPLLLILTLPVNIMTLGLFTFVIIGLLVLLTSAIVPGFHVDGFGWALAFAFVLMIVNSIFESATHNE